MGRSIGSGQPFFFFGSVGSFAGRRIRSCLERSVLFLLSVNPFACELSSTFIQLEPTSLGSKERRSFCLCLFNACFETLIALSDKGSATTILLAEDFESLAELCFKSLAELFSAEELLGFWLNAKLRLPSTISL